MGEQRVQWRRTASMADLAEQWEDSNKRQALQERSESPGQGEKRKAEEQLMPEIEADVRAVVADHSELIGEVSEEQVRSLVQMVASNEDEQAAKLFRSMHVDDEPPPCEDIGMCEPDHDEICAGMLVDGVTLSQEDVQMLIADEKRELDNMLLMHVIEFKPVDSITSEYRRLGTRWVRQKRGPKKWRCRIVAKDFRFLDPHMEHLHTSGACHVTGRLLDLVASIRNHKRMIGDTTNAYFHTKQNKLLFLDWLPALRRRAESMGYDTSMSVPVLSRKLYGERDASTEFGDLFTEVLEGAQFVRSMLQPQFYKHPGGVVAELHQDDIHMVGPDELLLDVSREIDKRLTMKWSKLLTVGDKYSFLKQQRVVTEDGVFLCANDKYTEDILASMSMSKCAGSPTPITMLRTGDESPLLDEEKTKCFRHCVSVA
eukprot:6226455-Amphidinium_carterae.1